MPKTKQKTDILNPQPVLPASGPIVKPKKVALTEGEVSKLPWNPWLAVVFVIVVFYASQVAAGLAVSAYPFLQHWDSMRANDWLNSSVWAQFFFVGIAEGLTVGALYLFLIHYKIGFKAIGLRRFRWSDPGWGLLAWVVYFIVYLIVIGQLQRLIPSLNVNQQQQLGFNNIHGVANLTLTFISLVILPPIVEEILVRGYLYGSLKKGMPQIAAALVTSVIFASAHLQAGSGAPLLWVAAIDTFTLSLFLIYLREKTGGLYASMTLHGFKNLLAFLALYVFVGWH